MEDETEYQDLHEGKAKGKERKEETVSIFDDRLCKDLDEDISVDGKFDDLVYDLKSLDTGNKQHNGWRFGFGFV